MTGSSQAYQVVSGLLMSLERGLVLQEDQPALTGFLLEGQIVSERLMESAETIDLNGTDEARLSFQLLHKGRVRFHQRDAPPTLLGGGAIDVVTHGLLTALEGGDGETRGNCFERPVKQVMKLAEVAWTLYTSADLPRTLFFRSPDSWKSPEDPEYWRWITLAEKHEKAWRLRLSALLLDPPDYVACAVRNLNKASMESKAELVWGIRRTADHYAALCKSGEDVFKNIDAGNSWDFEAQLLSADDF